MSNSTNHITYWDDFLEQATEYVSTYSWSIDLWEDPPDEYTLEYLLRLILENRYRSRYAMVALASDVPEELNVYKEKLIGLFEKAEEQLSSLLEKNNNTIQDILDNDFPKRSKALSNLLQDIQFATHDNFLFETENDTELRELCHDFLLRWQDLAVCLRELNEAELPWSGQFKHHVFADSFAKTEKKFKQFFDCFYPATDVLGQIQTEEPNESEFWWLRESPSKEKAPIPSFSEQELLAVKNAFVAGKAASCHDSVNTKQTIAYARGESTVEALATTRSHILSCKECLGLYLETRSSEPVLSKSQIVNVSTESFISLLSEKIKDLFNSIGVVRPPQYAMALTVACFCVASLFYISNNQMNDSQPAPMTSIMANLQIYSIRVVETRGGKEILERLQLKQDDVLKSGDSFSVEFNLNKDRHVYILSVDSNGQVTKLFSGVVTAGEEIHLPQQGGAYKLDQNTGSEFVYLLTAEKAIENFPEVLPKLTNQDKTGIEKILPDTQVYSFRFSHE